jgi:mannose-6-phosphate isomerase-like protein (cupin superfamily)
VSELVNRRVRRVLPPDEGETVWLRKLGIRFMIGGEETRGTFALVEHPIGPRALAAPMHTHEREDEYTYVLEGEIGVQIGEEVLAAQPGTWSSSPGVCRMPSGTRLMNRQGRLRSSPLRASSATSRS